MDARSSKEALDKVCKQWEDTTRLHLEYAEFRKMAIRDVNNYCAITTTGKVKRKGAYEWKKEWHQDASALVIPKVAEQVLLHDAPLIQTLHEWHDIMDFMMRIKVPAGADWNSGSRIRFNRWRTRSGICEQEWRAVGQDHAAAEGQDRVARVPAGSRMEVFPCNKLVPSCRESIMTTISRKSRN